MLYPPIVFKHPFTFIVTGPTQSGKTQFTKELLKRSVDYISPPPTHIYWCSGQDDSIQKKHIQSEIKNCNPFPALEFHHGMPTDIEFDPKNINLLVLDDLMRAATKSDEINDIFTKKSHHQNLSVILLLQNLFTKNKHTRELSINTKYLTVFKNPRDKSQIRHLSTQVSGYNSSFVQKAFNHATERPHGYLLFDFDQSTPDDHRLITGIFPPFELPIRFIPQKDGKT